jgi:hypothetical protein
MCQAAGAAREPTWTSKAEVTPIVRNQPTKRVLIKNQTLALVYSSLELLYLLLAEGEENAFEVPQVHSRERPFRKRESLIRTD